MRVVVPHDLRPYASASRVGGGFSRGDDVGARGVCQGEGGAVSDRETAPDELCRLPPL